MIAILPYTKVPDTDELRYAPVRTTNFRFHLWGDHQPRRGHLPDAPGVRFHAGCSRDGSAHRLGEPAVRRTSVGTAGPPCPHSAHLSYYWSRPVHTGLHTRLAVCAQGVLCTPVLHVRCSRNKLHRLRRGSAPAACPWATAKCVRCSINRLD